MELCASVSASASVSVASVNQALDSQCRSGYFSTDLIEVIRKLSTAFPEEKDYNGARDALIRLYNIYDLQLSDFTEGHLAHNNAKLAASDTYRVGRYALHKGDFYTSKDWFEESLRIMGDRNSTQDLAGEVKRVAMLENLGYSNLKVSLTYALFTFFNFTISFYFS